MTPPCKIAPFPIRKPGGALAAAREPKGGWTYFGCLVCPLRVWIPPGELITLDGVSIVECRMAAAPPS